MEASVTLKSLIKDFSLSIFYMPSCSGECGEKVEIKTSEINRPALPLIGYLNHFHAGRIQIIGITEMSYISEMDENDVYVKFKALFKKDIPALIFSTSLEPSAAILRAAQEDNIPILGTSEPTSQFMASLIASLNVSLAPMVIQHGVLIEVYGEGILILGDSGVGKSETAMELVKRGHRLVADDAVEIRRVSNKTLVGSSPPLIRHLIELRGIGLVDVRRIFGVGAVKETESIDLVVKLEPWNDNTTYDRLGMETEYHNILDLKKPCVTIPIKPGRNLAIIIEVAAINNRQRRLGYNVAADLNKRMMDGNFAPPPDDEGF